MIRNKSWEELVKDIDDAVTTVKRMEKEAVRYMTLQDIIEDERAESFKQGIRQGISQGISQGRIQNVKDMIKAGVTSLEAVKASGIYTEQELEAIASE